MIPSRRNAFRAVSLLLVLAIVQLYLPVAFTQQFIARLSSTRGGPILVNGNSTPVNGSIVTGAIVETSADQSATIDLGDIGELQMGPNTRLRLDYSTGQTKVTLMQGCAVLKTKENSEGEIETPQASGGKTDKKGGIIDVCFLDGKTITNQNAASNAISNVGAGAAGGGGGGGGLSAGVIWALVLIPVAGVTTYLLVRDTSDSTP